jgi:hypothetical protein
MDGELTDDAPWTEAQWEQFIERGEIRAAKYGELLETFMDHPDRDEIIDHEMGWDRPVEGDEDEWFDVEEMNRICEEAANDPEIAEEMRRDDEALKAMPAYARGFAFGLRVHDALKPFMEAASEAEAMEGDLGAAYINSLIIAAKLAGAHGMGYSDDVLCGNIVVCKKSLAAAQTCLEAMESLHRRHVVPAATLAPLIIECREVRDLVAEHIADLRRRVWWE